MSNVMQHINKPIKSILVLLLAAVFSNAAAAADCLEAEALAQLDRQYEQALKLGDKAFMQQLLADDFIWVHNLASSTENKAGLVERLGEGYQQPLARRSEDVKYRRLGNTAVLSGFTTVEQSPTAEGEPIRANKYHFMRTYVATDNQCQLLANQTMKVWSAGDGIQ